MFSVHTAPGEFKNAVVTGYFEFLFDCSLLQALCQCGRFKKRAGDEWGLEKASLIEESRARAGKSRDYLYVIVLERFRKCIPLKRKAGVFKFLQSVFKKFRFRDRVVWTVGLTVKIK